MMTLTLPQDPKAVVQIGEILEVSAKAVTADRSVSHRTASGTTPGNILRQVAFARIRQLEAICAPIRKSLKIAVTARLAKLDDSGNATFVHCGHPCPVARKENVPSEMLDSSPCFADPFRGPWEYSRTQWFLSLATFASDPQAAGNSRR